MIILQAIYLTGLLVLFLMWLIALFGNGLEDVDEYIVLFISILLWPISLTLALVLLLIRKALESK